MSQTTTLQRETLRHLPDYQGGSLANLPATLMQLFGSSSQGMLPPLSAASLAPEMLEGIETVIVVVADGLGHHQLLDVTQGNDNPNLRAWIEAIERDPGHARLSRITSVFPSSTIPALTSLATGLPPASHGLIGWMVHLKELGGPTEVANWRPANRIGSYLDPAWGMTERKAVLSHENIHTRLSRDGVETYAVGPGHFQGAPFTSMLYDGASYLPYNEAPEVGPLVADVMAKSRAKTRNYIHVYLPMVDSKSHTYGPRSPEHLKAVQQVDQVVGELMREVRNRPNTLLLVTADHGHIELDLKYVVHMNQIPNLSELLENLALLPTGERRIIYFHPLKGREDKVRTYLESRLGFALEIHAASDLFAHPIFGPNGVDPRVAERVGPLVALAKGEHQVIFNHQPVGLPPAHRGDHGGTSSNEMHIPLLAFRS